MTSFDKNRKKLGTNLQEPTDHVGYIHGVSHGWYKIHSRGTACRSTLVYACLGD
jgi:hypothetical protein